MSFNDYMVIGVGQFFGEGMGEVFRFDNFYLGFGFVRNYLDLKRDKFE